MTTPNQQPNILLIMADMLSASSLGAYGAEAARTPELDRLAARGTVFDTAYCNSPLCVPSRASMVCGRLPSTVNSFDNGSELAASWPTFAHELRLAGYQTILSGKMHFIGPDQLHGFEERLTTDIYPSGLHWTPDWSRGVYPNGGECAKRVPEAKVSPGTMPMDYDEEVLFRCRAKLNELSRPSADARPFFMCASFTHPHEPYSIPQEYLDRFEGVEIPAPRVPPEPLEQMHPYSRWIAIHHHLDQIHPTEEQVAFARRLYYAMVAYMDDLVGQLLSDLEKLGLAENTVIFFTSDHGDMLGERGMWFKRTFFEESMRVPLMVAGPGVASGKHRKEVVSLVDLYPTLVEVAKGPGAPCALEGAEGDSFAALLRGDDSGAWKNQALGEYNGEGTIQPMRMLRRGPWKYVEVNGEAPLLFNLEDDPLELRNRAGDPEAAGVEAELREALRRDWDGEAMKRQVMDDQRRRLTLFQALTAGHYTPWDFSPCFHDERRFQRGNIWYLEHGLTPPAGH